MMRTASWVIRNKATKEVVMETFDEKKVLALNTAKYEAVPIAEYLAELNSKTRAQAAAEKGQTLLGDGADITGRQVEYWGAVWTVKSKNYLGDWVVERFEQRPEGRMKVESSVSGIVLPDSHPHFCKLVRADSVSSATESETYYKGFVIRKVSDSAYHILDDDSRVVDNATSIDAAMKAILQIWVDETVAR